MAINRTQMNESQFSDVDEALESATQQPGRQGNRYGQNNGNQPPLTRTNDDGTQTTARGLRLGKIFLVLSPDGIKAESADSPRVLEAFKQYAKAAEAVLEKRPEIDLKMLKVSPRGCPSMRMATARLSGRDNSLAVVTLSFGAGQLPKPEEEAEVIEGCKIEVAESIELGPNLSEALDKILE